MSELRRMSKKEIDEILRKHKLWLEGVEGGERADFSGVNFYGANFTHADLRCADFSHANFTHADFSHANFTHADLRYADFSHADFSHAILIGADLSYAILIDADLRGSIFSGTTRLINPIDYINKNFEKTNEGYIAYKTFNNFYNANPNWKIEIGSVIEEEVDYCRTDNCGCGINVATLDWVKRNRRCDRSIYKVLIRNEWLMGVCVPYNTNGKIRCAKVEIIGIVEEGE